MTVPKMAKNIFITGANRGIGFHLLKKMVTEFKPEKVFATFRDSAKSKELQNFASHHPNVQLIQLDIRDLDKYDEVAMVVEAATSNQGLNLLINNAGVTSKVAKLSATRKSELMENLEINTIAPIMLTKALLPLLEKGSGLSDPDAPMGIGRAAVVNVSSILGSIQNNDQGGMYAYRCSKAALNAATRSMSLDFKKAKIVAVALHPGWVKTDMGGSKAPLSPEEATSGIITFLKNLGDKMNGQFYQYDGKQLPW